TIFFLSPGCQSTPKNPPPMEASQEAEPISQVVPAGENWSSQSSTYSGPSAAASSEPLTGLTPAERARSAPTRPEDPSSFLGEEAASEVSLAPQQFQTPPAASQTTTYTVVAGDSLWKISRQFGITIPELRELNPGTGSSLKPGDIINVPAGGSAGLQAAGGAGDQSTTSAAASATYVVRSGDSLSKIAARHGTTIAALRSANNLTSDVIQIGQKLVIPAGSRAPEPEAAAPQVDGVTVVIQSGETLGEIAQRFDVSVRDLMRANNITNARRVRAGQTIVIPGFQAVEGGPSAPVVTPRPAPPAPNPQNTPPPGETPSSTPSDSERTLDLDTLVPDDAPIVPIDEPVPEP
ncbi:MAG: LysM peptidoglycan-binding domain-containing protein, partial [Opitutaceae bacterium]